MSLDVTPDPEKTAEINAASEKLRDLIAKRPPPCAETRRQAAAVVAASLASSLGGQAEPPPARPEPAPTTRPARLGLGLTLLLVAALAGCSVDPELRRHVEAMDDACRELRDASQPAAGVDSAAWVRLRDSSERAHQTAVEAARD